MEKNRSGFKSINKFVDYLNTKKIFKGFRVTYQVVWNLMLIFTIIIVSGMLFVGGAGAGFFASLVKDEPIRSYEEMRKDIYNYEEVSEIYFADGQLIGELTSDLERREVALEDVSKHVINAIVATEDEYFFEHEGIVPKAILRATYQEFSNASLQSGGSTLTQQLIKNQILTNEVSFDRKAKEILLAMRLENFFEKEDILEAYLNVVPFGRNSNGRNIAGVQAAAQGIFGVDAKDLNIPQAAYIAGLPQSPFGYTPFIRKDGKPTVKNDISMGLNRMNTVLSRMKEKGYISEEDYQEALAYDIRSNLAEPSLETADKYPYLTTDVLNRTELIIRDHLLKNDGIVLSEIEDTEEREVLLREYNELAKRDLRRNGYKIHTTIDKDIYEAHQEIAKDDSLYPTLKNSEGKPIEVGAVLMSNQTGAIISFVGGRYFEDGDQLNRARGDGRPNGSTMKPLVAYAPAMELGLIQPGMIIPDTEHKYRHGGDTPTNWDNKYMGLLTVRESLQRSRNIPAIRSLDLVPKDFAQQKLNQMGINTTVVESSALGPHNVTVESNTAAYATFANGGTFVNPYLIERIETKDGKIIFEHKSTPVEVYSEQTAYLVTDMLRDVLVSAGTATRLPSMLEFKADIAGKTGTSNDTRDSLFVGYNPMFSLGVWIGFDNNETMKRVSGIGTYSQKVWAELANAAYRLNPDVIGANSKFQMPGGIVRQSYCGISGLRPSELCREAGLVTTDLFNAKYIPNKVDDSLERVNYVMIKGEAYLALPNTPPEFVEEGITIHNDLFDDENIWDNLPEKWNIIPNREAEENGKIPAAVQSIRLQGSVLTWGEHPENDIVGYRIYRAPSGSTSYSIIDIVRAADQLSYRVDPGDYAYYITAVDVGGRESKPSSIVKTGNWQAVIEPEEEEKEKEENNNEDQVDDEQPSDDQEGNNPDNPDEPTDSNEE